MKVLKLISPKIQGDSGVVGAARSAVMQSNYLIKEGVDISYCTDLSDYSLFHEDSKIIDDITYTKGRLNKDIMQEAIRVYKEGNFDILHSHVHSLSIIKWMDEFLDDSINFVHTLHTPTMLGMSSYTYGSNGTNLSNRDNVTLVAPSNHMQDVWCKFTDSDDLVPENVDNLVTVYNGVVDREIPLKDNKDRNDKVVFIGRIDQMKKAKRVADCLKQEEIPAIFIGDLWRNGTEEYYEKVRKVIESSPNIEWIRRTSNREVYRILSESRCLLTFSSKESFGRTAVESLSVGTPVLYASGGALEEIMEDGVTGFKLSVNDSRRRWSNRYPEVTEMYEKIDGYFEPNKLREYYKKNYTMKLCAKNYTDLYEKILEGSDTV